MISQNSIRFVRAIAWTAAIAIVAIFAPGYVSLPHGSFFSPPFVTHSMMLLLSLAAMALLSKGRFAEYGWTWGTYRFRPRILLWVLPSALLSLGPVLASHGGQSVDVPFGFNKLQVVVFIWIYASLCEETLVRGLLQTLLSRAVKTNATVNRWLSMPVLVSGLFFGAMHLILLKSMGLKAIPVIVFACLMGLVVAHYRDKTGSLLPAILIHALFRAF
jgi:membrane protease YdiL (CAAX protease family)